MPDGSFQLSSIDGGAGPAGHGLRPGDRQIAWSRDGRSVYVQRGFQAPATRRARRRSRPARAPVVAAADAGGRQPDHRALRDGLDRRWPLVRLLLHQPALDAVCRDAERSSRLPPTEPFGEEGTDMKAAKEGGMGANVGAPRRRRRHRRSSRRPTARRPPRSAKRGSERREDRAKKTRQKPQEALARRRTALPRAPGPHRQRIERDPIPPRGLAQGQLPIVLGVPLRPARRRTGATAWRPPAFTGR